jgi:hypothetical protein
MALTRRLEKVRIFPRLGGPKTSGALASDERVSRDQKSFYLNRLAITRSLN